METAPNDKRWTLRLSPHGRLSIEPTDEAAEIDANLGGRVRDAFARGAGEGLLWLGASAEAGTLPAEFRYWREFAKRYVTELCLRPLSADRKPEPLPPPSSSEIAQLVLAAPMMPGSEYVSEPVLKSLWAEIDGALAARLADSSTSLQDVLKHFNPAWNVVGRVHFNLAENRRDEAAPFAFLATYTTQMSAAGKAQHVSLGQALKEYGGSANREKLLALLSPVQRAAEQCPWLRQMVENREIFQPLRWTSHDAMQFLRDASVLEQSGVVLRMPANWRAGRPSRPKVLGTVGGKVPAGLGKDALLDFQVSVTLDGENLTRAEIEALIAATSGLAWIRGRWVEIDANRLKESLARFRQAEKLAAKDGLSFAEAMRMLAGAQFGGETYEPEPNRDWAEVSAGPWLAETLQALRAPEGAKLGNLSQRLNGQLRPYQAAGVEWLHLLTTLGLGACLADDMGLGKTIQVLGLLVMQQNETQAKNTPSVLIAPASLLANWQAEIERFAPSLPVGIAHASAMPAAELKNLTPKALADFGLVITTFGSLLRLPVLSEISWRFVIVDEAQALKNPGARQTRAVKQLKAHARVALTGTPVENRLADLWSIFDFINPGLLGSSKQFSAYMKNIANRTTNPFGPLRELVRPYILRRLKTDKRVIADLPDKTELKAYCQLSRRQAALYQQAVEELRATLGGLEGIERRGAVLAFLMRFKQICNHPSQWLGDAAWAEDDSGKWSRLRELTEVIAAKQEKVLVFTQFRELAEPLATFLAAIFRRMGLILHGGTAVKKRRDLVNQFQEDESVPFFVLSLKAGGSGLNLTAASHVVHFDRWWNPAVENQATDRAFRIGQKKNVLVHKFICRGTVEEKIDALIESKQLLSRDLLDSGNEVNLTELSNAELLDLVKLDINSASGD